MSIINKAIKAAAKPIAQDIYAALSEVEAHAALLPEGDDKDALLRKLKALHDRLYDAAKNGLGLSVGESDDADVTILSGGGPKD